MEFVSELFERLEDEERPFPKRMRLAQNAYYATGGSSERILAWISSRLKNISQEDFNEFCTIWKKLAGSVHNQHIRHLVKLVLEVVNEYLTDYKRCVQEDIFPFVISVLENTRVQNYFFTDLDTYVTFMKSLLSALASGPIKDENVSKRVFETMEVFARMVSLREYPECYLDQLLLPSVHLVNSVEPYSLTLEKHLVSCIEMAVFFRSTSLVATYLDALLKSGKKKSEQNKEQSSLKDDNLKSEAHLKTGHKLLEKLCSAPDESDKNDVLLAYTAIFKCLAKTSSASLLSFKMLIAISPLIGINVNNAKLKVELPEDLKKCSKDSPDELSFEILNSVLSVILKESVPFPDEGELQCVNWIECLWRTVLSVPVSVRQSGAYMCCLTTLLLLHPRVIMIKNLPIITDVLVILTPEKEIPEFGRFLHTLMSIHQKGFLVQELLKNIYTSSKQLLNTRKRLNTSTLSVDAIVPPSVYEDIQQYAVDWTSTPVLDFMDFMTTQLQTLACASENMRNIHTDTSTALAVRLMCGVLSGARIVDHSGNEKIRLAYVNRLNNLSQALKQMGALANTSDNMVLIKSFLDLENTWAAVAIMLQQYCPEASEALRDFAPQPIEDSKENHSPIIRALSFVHSHIVPSDWELIRANVAKIQDSGTRHALVRLELQSLRYFIVSSSRSSEEVAAIAKEVLPELVHSMDLENMIYDIYSIAKYLEGDELKLLVDKLVEILVSSSDEDRQRLYARNFLPLQEIKSVICGMVLNLFGRLENICSSSEGSENSWITSEKILQKLTSSGVDSTNSCISEEWNEVLSSLGKSLHKAFKKSHASGITSPVEQPSVRRILNVLNLIPLEHLPENLQTAVIFVMLGLSVDLVSIEESEEKSSLVELIYNDIVFGMLERWPITTEAPPLQTYVNIADVISHVKSVISLRSAVNVNIVHTLLGISLKSEKSVNKVLQAFFSDETIPAEDYAVQEEMLKVVCRDSFSSECREILKSSDCESRVVSYLLNIIRQQRPKKHYLPIYTLLLSRSLRKDENFDDLIPILEPYCKISLKILRNEKQKRVKGEEFFRETLKYHKLLKFFPENFLLDVWNVLLESDEPSCDIAILLFAGANKDDFHTMVQCIMNELERTVDSSITRANVLLMWEALIKSPVIAEQSLERRTSAISFFLAQQHVFLNYPVNHLLRVLLSIVESSKIVVLVYTADHILQAVSIVMNRKNRKENMALISSWFAILNSLLFHRTSQTLDCLPAFMAQLRLVVQNVVSNSRNSEHLESCISVAQGIEKMFQTIVKAKLTRNFSRIGAYFLADLLKHFEGHLPQEMKVILENIACEILGFLDTYARRFLSKVVNSESSEIFKEISRIRELRRPKIV